MKKVVLIVVSFLLSTNLFAADNEAQTVRQFKISYLNPGVEFEQPIMKKASVIVHPAVGYSFIAGNDGFVGVPQSLHRPTVPLLLQSGKEI